MNLDELHGRSFLEELARQTGRDTAAQVSMHEVGAAIGLDKGEAGSLAESLIIDGLAELKTLSGGIGITEDGLASIGLAAPAEPSSGKGFSLGPGPVAAEHDRQTVAEMVRRIREAVSGRSLAYDQLEEIVMDIKTLELHLLSPKPKIAVLRELLRSLQAVLAAAGIREAAEMLEPAVGRQ